MLHIHSDDLANIGEIAQRAAQGRPPIVGSTFLAVLEKIAQSYPHTLLELLAHIEAGEPLTPGPYE